MTIVQQAVQANEIYDILGRAEEPMEVGSVQSGAAAAAVRQNPAPEKDPVAKQLEIFTLKLAKMETAMKQNKAKPKSCREERTCYHCSK